MAKSVPVLFSFLTVIATISSGACAGDSAPKNFALIVAVVEECGSLGHRSQHLMKYEFVKGGLVSTETVVSNPGGQLRFNCDESQLYQDRYVITDLADIVDITTDQFLHRGGSGSGYTQLLGMEEDRVFIHTPQTEEYHYYDLTEQEYRELEDPGKWALPGVLSSDGTMSVESNFFEPYDIWLYDTKGNKRSLGTGFRLEQSGLASTLRGVPLMWLDKESILTQKSNGEIVVVKVDGTVEPIVSIEVNGAEEPDSKYATLLDGALYASLSRDRDGNIIYYIKVASSPGSRFLIDVEDKSYSAYDPEWADLGHEFEYASPDNIAMIRFEGHEIGQEQYFNAGYVQTVKGHIAFTSRRASESYPTAIRVWSCASQEWTTIDFEFPIWITHSAIIGWLETD